MSARFLSRGRARAAACLLLVACAKAEDRSPSPSPPQPAPAAARAAEPSCTCPPEAAPVVDATLLAFLSKARASHQQADLAEDAGERARAITALDPILGGPHPGGAMPVPEVEEVLADTRARRAELRAATGDFAGAVSDIDAGLVLARASTYFRGHLFEVRGAVEKRRAEVLAARGDRGGAKLARGAALEALGEAVRIQDEVITGALGAADAGAPQAPRTLPASPPPAPR